MPGAYAHITAAYLASQKERLRDICNGDDEVAAALLQQRRFFLLGAVSPDYPYFTLLDGSSREWADVLHRRRTGERLAGGVEILKARIDEEGLDADNAKLLAWLMGYAAHMGMDLTIHPLLEIKVGPFEENETDHRECEMHQDVHIFKKKMHGGGPSESNKIANEIGRCHAPEDEKALDPGVVALWEVMLEKTDADLFAESPPQMDAWHVNFLRIAALAKQGDALFAFARHMAEDNALVYPQTAGAEFVEALETPEGAMDYDRVFERAVDKVEWLWRLVCRAVCEGDDAYVDALRDWDLDTGRVDGELAFWKES